MFLPGAPQDRTVQEVLSSGEPRLSGDQLPWFVAECTPSPGTSFAGHPVLSADADGPAPGWTVLLAPGPGIQEEPGLELPLLLVGVQARTVRIRSPRCVRTG